MARALAITCKNTCDFFMITSDNWTFSFYRSPPFKAFISLGGDQKEDGTGAEILYMATLLEGENELNQKVFSELRDACHYLNDKYGPWEFVDLLNTGKEGSCSSCIAH